MTIRKDGTATGNEYIGFRLDAVTIRALNKRGKLLKLNRSDTIRRILRDALAFEISELIAKQKPRTTNSRDKR